MPGVDNKPARFAAIGAGNMGSAIIDGSVLRGGVPPHEWAAADPSKHIREQLASRGVYTVETADGLAPLLRSDGIVLLAVKPQMLPDVAPALTQTLADSRRVVLSILAGVTTDRIRRALGDVPGWHGGVLRAMPNTPASVGKGLSAIAVPTEPEARRVTERMPDARALLSALGSVFDLDESMIDAFTAIAGSGPAYLFAFVEALGAAGRELGFDDSLSMQLASGTVVGAAHLLEIDALTRPGGLPDPAALRIAVTSRRGTTEAALEKLTAGGLREIVLRAAESAARRAGELARET